MNGVPFLEALALQEPWRQGVGVPTNALDPAWFPSVNDSLCLGEVDWEHGTRWWYCKKCGRIGSIYLIEHKPAQNPVTFLLEAVNFFAEMYKKDSNSLGKMAFIAGTAIRYAAVQPDLGDYASKLVTK